MQTSTKPLLLISALFLATAAIGIPKASAQAKPDQARVRHRVRLEVVKTENKAVVKYTVDEAPEFNELREGATFLTGGPIVLTLRQFNPLTTQVTVTVNDADDPTYEVMGKLVESLLGMAATLGAKVSDAAQTALDNKLSATLMLVLPPGSTETCDAEKKAVSSLTAELESSLFDPMWGPSELQGQIADWQRTIEDEYLAGRTGAAAMNTARQKVAAFLGLTKQRDTTLAELLAKADHAIATLDAVLAKENPTACESAALGEYRMLRLTNPYERRRVLGEIQKTVKEIHDLLDGYARMNRWSTSQPTEFIIRDSIEPTSSVMKNISVTFTDVSYSVPASTGLLSAKRTDLVSTKMTVRRYLAWVPEIGVGLTYSRVTRKTYGTGKNDAGQTIITQGPESTQNVDPTVLVNFTCGFCALSPVTPMFQVGTSTSKDTQAIFLGGGFKFADTPKGAFAVGIGWALPFAKQLKPGVELNTVIDGTADLEKNLEWARIPGQHFYLNIQYKF